jgi:hypothetical protein
VVFKAQPYQYVSEKIGGKSTVVTTEVGFKLSEYYGIWRQYCKSHMGLNTAYRKYHTGGILTLI